MIPNRKLTEQSARRMSVSRRGALRGIGGGLLATVAGIAIGHEHADAQGTPTSCPASAELAANKALVLRMFGATFNAHDPAAVDRFMAPDYVEHHVPAGVPPTRDSLKEDLALLFTAFPDARMTFEATCAEGDMVWVRDVWHGTFRGRYYGQPPTGKPVSQESIDIFRIAQGKIVAHWAVSDDLGLLRQFGLLPARGAAASPAATPVR